MGLFASSPIHLFNYFNFNRSGRKAPSPNMSKDPPVDLWRHCRDVNILQPSHCLAPTSPRTLSRVLPSADTSNCVLWRKPFVMQVSYASHWLRATKMARLGTPVAGHCGNKIHANVRLALTFVLHHTLHEHTYSLSAIFTSLERCITNYADDIVAREIIAANLFGTWRKTRRTGKTYM